MHLLWRRYSSSGYAPQAFYLIAAVAFATLAVWALVQAEWLVAALAALMIVVTAAGSRLMRRLAAAARASEARYAPQEEEEHE